MEGKISVIKSQLQKAFPSAEISHERIFDSHNHRFRIDIKGKPRYWLYIGSETFDDHEPAVLINFLNIYRIVDAFKRSDGPCRIFLGEEGVKEVGKDFGMQ